MIPINTCIEEEDLPCDGFKFRILSETRKPLLYTRVRVFGCIQVEVNAPRSALLLAVFIIKELKNRIYLLLHGTKKLPSSRSIEKNSSFLHSSDICDSKIIIHLSHNFQYKRESFYT